MPTFVVTHEWKQQGSKLIPEIADFRPAQNIRHWTVNFQDTTLQMTTTGQDGKPFKIEGNKLEYPTRTYSRDFDKILAQYSTHSWNMYPGNFNLFIDGTAELISTGSGIPIIEVDFGPLLGDGEPSVLAPRRS
jgi:hypothetical protein